jgi:hypothetical protein
MVQVPHVSTDLFNDAVSKRKHVCLAGSKQVPLSDLRIQLRAALLQEIIELVCRETLISPRDSAMLGLTNRMNLISIDYKP